MFERPVDLLRKDVDTTETETGTDLVGGPKHRRDFLKDRLKWGLDGGELSGRIRRRRMFGVHVDFGLPVHYLHMRNPFSLLGRYAEPNSSPIKEYGGNRGVKKVSNTKG